MNNAWVIVFFLLIIVIITQAVFYRRLKAELRQVEASAARFSRLLLLTRRKMAEMQNRRKKLLAASTQALVIVENDYSISSANKMAKRLFGPLPKTATFTQWTRQHQLRELVDQILQGQKVPPVYLSRNDKMLEVHARAIKSPTPEGPKVPVAVALAINDVTELHRLTRSRRDFVANISHELRSPLASLQLLVDTLCKGALNDPQMAPDLLDKIVVQVDTLNQLAQELLDLSIIESGQSPLRMSAFSLRDIAQAQLERLWPQAQRKDLTLANEIDPDLRVLVDETMIGRVITNLIHNGIKFTENGGVTISAQKVNGQMIPNEKSHEDWVLVCVTDTGVGIPPDEISRIFERFYKIDRARSRKESGTGMGLAIARHIVEGHGGRIWAESDGKSGSTFYFTLPPEE
jgi:two-component system, OmpR family, phosphate regulon sensor histidine kinase PhoR